MMRDVTRFLSPFVIIVILAGTFAVGVVVGPSITAGRSMPLIASSPVPTVAPTIQPFAAPTETDLAQGRRQAAFLINRYGVPETEVTSLTKLTYEVADIIHYDRSALHAVVLDFAENGGAQLRPFGIEGDPDSVARKVGYSSGAALRALTSSEVVRIRTVMATQGLAQFLLKGSG